MSWITDFDPEHSEMMVRAAYDSGAIIEGTLMPSGNIYVGAAIDGMKPLFVPALRKWSDGDGWHTVSGARYVTCLWDKTEWQQVPQGHFNPYAHTPFAVVVNGQRYEQVSFIYGDSYLIKIEDGDMSRVLDAKDVSYWLISLKHSESSK